MSKLTEPMIIARTKCSDLNVIKKLNCWGNELSDVSLVQRMPNVEVLAFSVNNISSLADFQHCSKLSELYLRKNKICSLNEVCYLQHLPNLKNLNLIENPCTNNDYYRLSVVKALPRLKTLDDQEVSEEERRTASRQGRDLIHPEDCDGDQSEAWPQDVDYQEHRMQGYSNGVQSAAEASNGAGPAPGEQCWEVDLEESESAATGSSNNFDTVKVSPGGGSPSGMESPEPQQRCYQSEYNDRRNANYDSSEQGYMRSSYQQQQAAPAPQYQQQQAYYAQSPTSPECHSATPRRRPGDSSPDTPPSPSTPPFVQATPTSPMQDHAERGTRCRADGEARLCSELPLFPCAHQAAADDEYYRSAPPQSQQPRQRFSPAPAPSMQPPTRRKSRTSNILSAVLCLLKELDYQSLEVVDNSVNARMHELMHEHAS